MVTQYSRRQLTYAEDVLKAFSACITITARSFNAGILYGIPETFFDGCLLWEPSKVCKTPLERRKDVAGNTLQQFPSWSWVGWSGAVDCSRWEAVHHSIHDAANPVVNPLERQADDRIYPMVTWYKLPKRLTGAKQRIESTYCKREPLPYRENPPVIGSSTEDTWSHILSCNARRVYLLVSKHWPWKLDSRLVDERIVPLVDSAGIVAGVLTLPSRHLDFVSAGQECELICISKEQRDARRLQDTLHGLAEFHILCEDHPFFRSADPTTLDPARCFYKFYNVLWIEWKDNIAYRISLGRIFEEYWDSAQTEEIDLLLG